MGDSSHSVSVDDDGPIPKRMKTNSKIGEGILLGYGNPLLDISVGGTKDFLDKYDLLPDNAILAEDKHKPMYQDMIDTFKDVEYVPGGATQNSIKVAQWLLQVPKATTYFGCISKDKFGEILENKTKAAGVNIKYQYTDKEPTGTCAVIVTGDNRSLCANLAAANCFTEDHLDAAENWELVQKAKYFYVAGFPLTVCPAAILRIAKHAKQEKKTFCMNLGAPFLCHFFKKPMLEVLPFVNVLFGNETEAASFSEANDLGTSDVREIAIKIAAWKKEDKTPRTVVITQGSLPIIVVKAGVVKEYPVIPIQQKDIVDCNGAGDAFVGGFLAQFVQEKPIDECVRCGNYAANTVIQRSGCTYPENPEFK